VGGNRTWVNDAAGSAASSGQSTGGLAGVPRRWPQAGGFSFPGSHGVGYVCRRCGKAGHFLPNCPTNGDPSYDKQPPQKLMNTSTGSRKIVATLEGIETKNKTVIHCIKAFHHRILGFYLFHSQLDSIVTLSQIEIKFRNYGNLFKCCISVNKNWGVYNTIGKSAL
jgi:Zinc knuckle